MSTALRTPPPDHIEWIVDDGRCITTAEGRMVRIIELRHQRDERVLSAWAKHFRHQYCDDDQIDALCSGTGLSRAAYLRSVKFPDESQPPGPSIRAGDFGEILVADYMEFVIRCMLPRTRYDRKDVRNESTKGTDIVGFRLVASDRDDPDDVLALFESKAQFSGRSSRGRLQDAVDGSVRDQLRKAESLNAIKQRYLDGSRLGCVSTT